MQQTQWVREAQTLQRLGQAEAAITAYERILQRWPDLPDCWFNLAVLQRTQRRYEAALASYRKALDHGVRAPEEVHLNRAVILTDHLHQHAAAERELQQALRINPTYVSALLNLANLQEDTGRRAQASALYQQILTLDPQCLEALARYANAQPAAGASPELTARLRSAIRGTTDNFARASLGFALGRLLDGQALYREAFEAYRDANVASRNSAPPGQALYDRRRQEELVDALIRSSPLSVTEGAGTAQETAAPATGNDRPNAAPLASNTTGPTPIFICGLFRSGSTLAERLLARHPGVAAGGELDLLPATAAAIPGFPASLPSLTAQQRSALAERYQTELARLPAGAPRITDKRLDNFLLIGLIKSLFPAARIVHTTRDPLDNCLSIYFLHLDQRMSYALDLMDTGHYYRQYRRLMAHWQRRFGPDLFELNYDSFVHDPAVHGRRLFEFLGLDWDERYLAADPNETAGSVKTASVWQVREPIYTRSSGRALHYAQELRPLRDYLSDLLAEGSSAQRSDTPAEGSSGHLSGPLPK